MNTLKGLSLYTTVSCFILLLTSLGQDCAHGQSVTVSDYGFESPAVANGAFDLAPTGSGWTFSNSGQSNSGILGPSSSLPAAPQGTQEAYIQSSGSISHALSSSVSGVWTVTFYACGGLSDIEGVNVSIDSTKIGTVTPSSQSSYSSFTYLTTSVLSSGSHTLTFAGTNNALSGMFLDDVQVSVGPPSAPPAPTGLSATAGVNSVSLNWSASAGAASYNVYQGAVSGGENLVPIATGVSVTSYSNTGLTNGSPYFYKVVAVNPAGKSGYSNEASATPQIAAPAAPTYLSAMPGNAEVALSWTASPSAASYNVYQGESAGGESATPIATGITTASYTSTGLTNSTAYFYKVAAVNAGGTSAYSEEASATPVGAPAAPTNLNATSGDAQVTLSWKAPPGATYYNVYQGGAAGGESATPVATGITTTSYTNTGLTNGAAYFFKVVATDAGGTSGYSNEASATPAAYATANFAGTDATTQGNWQGVYGGDGFNVVNDPSPNNNALPGYVTGFGENGASTETWAISQLPAYSSSFNIATLDPTYLQVGAAGSVNRILGALYSSSSFTLSGAFNPPQQQATCADAGSTTTLVTSSPIPVGASMTITSGTIANIGRQVAVAASTFEESIGYYLVTLSTALPGDTAPGDGFTYISPNIALYVIDYPNQSGQTLRSETITAENATTGAILGTPVTVAAGAPFTTGEYLVWTVSGSVQFVVTNTGGPNCAVSGIFFGGAVPTVPPPSPTALTAASALNCTSALFDGDDPYTTGPVVELAWTPNTASASYNVYRATSAADLEGATPLVTGITSPTYTDVDSSLQLGTTYYYAVAAVNGLGISQLSNVASETLSSLPAAPTGLVVGQGPSYEPTSSSPVLYWVTTGGATGANGNAQNGATYNIYRGTEPGTETLYTTGRSIYGPVVPGYTIGQLTSWGWIDEGATMGQTYYYRVATVNSNGVSPLSNEVSVTAGAVTPLGAANAFVMPGPNSGQATISWSAVPNAASYVVWGFSAIAPPNDGFPNSVFSTGSSVTEGVVPANAGNTGPYSFTAAINALTTSSSTVWYGVPDTYPFNAGPEQNSEYWYGVAAVNAQGVVQNICYAYMNGIPNTLQPQILTGSVFPKYQVLSVQYAPPGGGLNKNTAIYSTADALGTTTSYTNAFTYGTTVTTSETSGVDILGIGGTQTSTYAAKQSSTTSSSSSIAVNNIQTLTSAVSGQASPEFGVSHDADIIYVWLNPVLNFTIPKSPYNNGSFLYPTPVTWTGYSFNQSDPAGNMDVVSVPVGMLNGDVTMSSQVYYWLSRIWASPSKDGTVPGLTSLDYGDILNADPFAYNPYPNAKYNNYANGTKNPSGVGTAYSLLPYDSTGDTSGDGRYTKTIQSNGDWLSFDYAWLGTSLIPAPQTYTASTANTSTVGQGTSDTHETDYTFTGGVSFKLPAGANLFTGTLTASLADAQTWTWVNTWSSLITAATTTSAAVTIYWPEDLTGNPYPEDFAPEYPGNLGTIDMWQDNVYGTFMFNPAP